MQKKLIAIFIAVSIASFFYGVSVGFYKVPPYQIFNKIDEQLHSVNRNDSNNVFVMEQNIDSLIHINSDADILNERKKLIQYVWKTNEFPIDKLPTSVVSNFKDSRYSSIKNLSQIEKITISMENGVDSIAYLFLPIKSNNKLIIYHHGHDGDFILGIKYIDYFLENNYSVLAFSMPLTGMNSKPVVNFQNHGNLTLTTHNDFSFLESDKFSSIKYFVEPIAVSLNYMDANYDFSSYYMTGISGGGWTTAFYSAIDPRIIKNFPVAGTAPIHLRLQNSKDIGDFEQMLPSLYNTTNYLDQYILASYGEGREQLQIFNKNDPCCFSGDDSLSYQHEIQERLSNLGSGKFSIFIDEDNMTHSISEKSLKIILEHIEN